MALSPRDRRALIILGVLAVAALGFFLLTRGGEEAAETGAAPTQALPPPPVVEPTPTPKPPKFSFFSGRDPFDPLVVAEGTGGAGTAAATTETEEGTGEVTEPGEGAEEGVGGGATTEIGGHTVTLIDIFDQAGEQFAQVQVDGETFVVGEGESFADNFRLVSIQGGCASFLFGDEGFTLCEGGERK